MSFYVKGSRNTSQGPGKAVPERVALLLHPDLYACLHSLAMYRVKGFGHITEFSLNCSDLLTTLGCNFQVHHMYIHGMRIRCGHINPFKHVTQELAVAFLQQKDERKAQVRKEFPLSGVEIAQKHLWLMVLPELYNPSFNFCSYCLWLIDVFDGYSGNRIYMLALSTLGWIEDRWHTFMNTLIWR